MTPLKTVIIDDEKDARYLLRHMIDRHLPQLDIVAEADDVDSGIDTLKRLRPDLVLLDIHLSSGDGFDILENIPDPQFEIVFLTAYDQYAIKAFQFSAFSYLLKPLMLRELRAVTERLVLRRESQRDTRGHVKILVEQFRNSGQIRKIVIPHLGGFTLVELADLAYLSADGNYTHFHLANGEEIMSSRTLKSYESVLFEEGFFRIHQSFMINLNYVTAFQKGENTVRLRNGVVLQVSRTRKAAFVDRFLS
ncbi:MAG: LytTR family DNA-binding domain-containing protein [Bacteroidota bacterium]